MTSGNKTFFLRLKKYQSSYPAEVRSEIFLRVSLSAKGVLKFGGKYFRSATTFSRAWVSESENFTKISRQNQRDQRKKTQISRCWGVPLTK